MKVLVLHESLRAGGLRRLESIVASANGAGHEVLVVEVPQQRDSDGLTPMVWRWWRLRRSDDFAALVPDTVEVLHIQGLPLAYAAVAAARRRLPTVVDCCDSGPALAWGSRTDRGLLRAALGVASSMAVLLSAARRADVVTYISAEEAGWDRLALRGIPRLAVPNTIDQRLFALPRQGPPRALVTVSDFAYAPNLEGLTWALKHVWPGVPGLRWDLYGPVAPAVELPEEVAYRGFVRDLVDIYREDRVAFVPLLRGRGVKNKVLEGLAAGLPVVTTSEGIRGLTGAREHTWTADAPIGLINAIRNACTHWDHHNRGGRTFVLELTEGDRKDVWRLAMAGRGN